MKAFLAHLEWYINKCRDNGRGLGYYDSFKNAPEQHGDEVDAYKRELKGYWKKVVEDAEKKPQLPTASLRNWWLFAGTNYWRIVEPLDIAEYYGKGRRRDYITRERSKHYKQLDIWLVDYQKATKKGKGRQDGSFKSQVVNVTEDSCFWAHVEDAIRSCRPLDRARVGSSGVPEGEKPFDFEKYVMDLINKKKVSSDIFLEKSSYMKWWKEYQEIWNKKVKEGSHSQPSELVHYMTNGRYKDYGDGPSTSGDPHS